MENLIVLMFGPNSCYPQVVDYEPKKIEGLEVNTEEMTWTYNNGRWNFSSQIHKIGKARYLGSENYGVIGVFTKDTEQINSLVHAWREASREDSHSDD